MIHARAAAVSKEHASARRTMFIIFTDVSRLPVEFMGSSRQLHTKARANVKRERADMTPAFHMGLRKRKRD